MITEDVVTRASSQCLYCRLPKVGSRFTSAATATGRWPTGSASRANRSATLQAKPIRRAGCKLLA